MITEGEREENLLEVDVHEVLLRRPPGLSLRESKRYFFYRLVFSIYDLSIVALPLTENPGEEKRALGEYYAFVHACVDETPRLD